MKLSIIQKETIKLMREGNFIFENLITRGARCAIGKEVNGNWGNIHSSIMNQLLNHGLIMGNKLNIAIRVYQLTTIGKTIEL